MESLAIEHIGIIRQRVYYFWRRLPASVKAGYDTEDMVNEVVLTILRFESQYDKQKACASTFVYHCANRKCLAILTRYNRKKRTVEMVPMEGVIVASRDAPESRVRLREARDAVRRVYDYASDPAKGWLLAAFRSKAPRPSVKLKREILLLSRQHGARPEDFRLAMEAIL